MSRRRRAASSSTAEPSAASRELIALQHSMSSLPAGNQSMLKPAPDQMMHAAFGRHLHALALRSRPG